MEEDYSTSNTTTRGSFLYPPPSVKVAPIHNLLEMNNSFLSPSHQVKSEATSSQHAHKEFYHSLLSTNTGDHQQQTTLDHFLLHQQRQREHEERGDGERNYYNNNNNKRLWLSDVDSMKAKIISHPQYSNLLEAYMDCQKVGAPEEVVNRLAAVQREFETRQRATVSSTNAHRDPELDQFMEAYCDLLVKYREELTRPLQEAMDFFRKIESQLNTMSNDPIRIFTDEKRNGIGSPEDDQDDGKGAPQVPEIDPRAEDKELKDHLLKRYSGCLSRLKQELSKKKKKCKLPKEARQKLLNWWELHYKWPYPSETEKGALAESTGLDQKQINNWFINQRKRHWKPSEDPQFVMMDGPLQHPPNTVLYMDGHFMADGPYRLVP